MKNWKKEPHDEGVARYVDCYWWLERDEDDVESVFPRLIPNPSAHLIMTPDDQHHKYRIDGREFLVRGTHLISPSTSFSEMTHDGPLSILGIKFRVGALYSLVRTEARLPLNAVSDDRACLPFGFSWEGFQRRGVDLSGENPEEVVRAMDALIAPKLQGAREDNHSRLVREAIETLRSCTLQELEGQLSCSRRTLERSFLRVTGLTLKQYEGLVRLDRLIMYLYRHRHGPVDWADVAASFGFSDQSHLIRQLKKAIGETPGSYHRRRNLTIDAYGDFE